MFYTHFNKYDRIRLATLLKTGLSFRKCANYLGFSPSAISYEVNRHGGRDNYQAVKANQQARIKRLEANQCHRKFKRLESKTERAIELLKKGWSPEQIIGRNRLELKRAPFSVATIYNNVNQDPKLASLLPRKHNKYRHTRENKERKKQRELISKMKPIEERGKKADQRERIGDWEGDTIVGKERTVRILTYVERKTGYLLASMLYIVSAERVSIKTCQVFSHISKNKALTITTDRGIEFFEFESTERRLKLEIYFANPYHAWERGTNENTNGLIRRYFPKKTFFSNIKEDQLQKAVKQINHRPRKRLGYRTPFEEFHNVKLRTLI